MTKIIYIAGYGRSGSTVLDIVLGNHSEIVGVGEICCLLEEWTNQNRTCSCGKTYADCDFWKKFVDIQFSVTPHNVQLLKRIDTLTYLPFVMLGMVSKKNRSVYRDYHSNLFEYITKRANKTIVVDSSKSSWYSAGRFFALKRLADCEVYVIHLVRNGLAVMESLISTGSNRMLENQIQPPKWPTLRAVFGWISANVWTSVLGSVIGPKHYMRLRYEDFVSEPDTTLMNIGRFCNFDADELIGLVKKNCFVTGHKVGGNRIRFQEQIRLHKKGRHKCHEYQLKPFQFVFFTLAGGWLQHFYGYYDY